MTDLGSKIKSGSIWLGIRFIISGLLGVIAMPLIARTLSVEEYGIYNILFAVSVWVSILTGFGLPNIFQRFIPEALQSQDYGLIKSLVKKGLLVRLILSVFAVVFLALFPGPIGNVFNVKGWERYFLIFLIAIICMLEVGLWRVVFNGLFLQKYAVISNICWSSCRVILISLVVLWGKGLTAVLIVETVSWIVWLSLLAIFYHKYFLAIHKETDKIELPYKRFLRYGGFSFLSEMGSTVLDMATDLFVITIYLGPVAAGIYGFCDRIIKLFRQVLPHAVLRNIIQPVFFAHYAETQNLKELEKMFNFLTKLTALFLFPLAIWLCVLGKEFIFYIFGEKYLSAYLPLCIIISFFAANAFSESAGLVLQSIEKVNILFYSKIFAFYNLVGDLLVVKSYGVVGVALVTSSAVLFKNLFCLYFTRQYINLHIHFVSLMKIVTNALLMGLALSLMRPYIDSLFSFILISAIGAVVYFAICFFNKAFTSEERRLINKMLPMKLFIF